MQAPQVNIYFDNIRIMKYKFIIIVSFVLFSCHITYGQNAGKKHTYGKIGITFSSFGANNVDMGNLICDCGYNSAHFYNIGFTYLYPITGRLSVETGLEYSHQTIQVDIIKPNLTYNSYKTDFYILDIPLTARLNFLHYFFANGGLLVDIDPNHSNPIGNQTGLGEMFGIGATYNFNFGISLFVNPYLKFHSNVPSFSHKDSFNLNESGFRFGIEYNL